jgi:putative spermidine/putrescine transport system substrate-binding protein
MGVGMTARRLGGTALVAGILATSLVGGSVSAQDAPTCDAVEFGPAIVRCENFTTDFWPIINAKLDELYASAKATDGGQLVIWDWYPRSDEEIAAFNARFPDIKVVTQGFEYNLGDAIVTAQETGQRNSDVVSGSITSMTQMYDQGYWKDVDWTTYGVPAEFMAPWGYTELLPDSFNSPLLQSNVTKTTTVPGTLDELNTPEMAKELGIASWNAQNFTGYGMANGQEAMLGLIQGLLDNGMTISDSAGDLLSSGDLSMVLGGQLFSDNPDLAVNAFAPAPAYAQFSGVNTYATNPDAAALWILWYAYDPDWLKTRLTDPAFGTSSLPYPGLPASTFDQSTGLIAKNQAAYFAIAQDPTTVFETKENRDEYNAMIDAANGLFYQ